MLIYFIRRVLLAIPLMFLISLGTYCLSVRFNSKLSLELLVTPEADYSGERVVLDDPLHKLKVREVLSRYHFDLPVFYFSLGALAEPDTLFSIYDPEQRQTQLQLLWTTGNWEGVQAYYRAIDAFSKKHATLVFNDSIADRFAWQQVVGKSLGRAERLKRMAQPGNYLQLTKEYIYQENVLRPLRNEIDKVVAQRQYLEENPQKWKLYVPKFFWYGGENQYHKWLTNVLTQGDFGRTKETKEPVLTRIAKMLPWSLGLGLISFLLSFLLSIPMAIFMANYHGKWQDRLGHIFLLGIGSIPGFWFATLLLFAFANPDMLDWFPSALSDSQAYQMGFWASFKHQSLALILPLIAYTYGALAFYSRQMRANLLQVLGQNYIISARVKGLSGYKIWRDHVLKNALMPMITLFAGLFPALMGGAIILETIFSIPGMGRETIRALVENDVHMIAAIFTISGILTILGYIISDMIAMWVDPRIGIDQ